MTNIKAKEYYDATTEFILFVFVIIFSISMLLNINQTKSNIVVPTNLILIDYISFFFIISIKNSISFFTLWLSYKLKKKIIPFIFLVVNGYVLALLISKLPNVQSLLLILPHGIIEIIIFYKIIILSILGIENILSKEFINSKYIHYYFFILLAAGIEGLITPILSIHFLK